MCSSGFQIDPAISDYENEHEFVLQKLRQQVRESSEELRNLEAKFKACFVYREQKEQLQERQLLEEKEQMFAFCESETLSKYWQQLDKDEEEQLKSKRLNLRKDQEVIKRQIREKEVERIKELQNKLQERLQIDKIAYQIYKEDEMARKRKICLKIEQKKTMIDFIKAKEEWQEKERLLVEEENRKIKKYWDEKNKVPDSIKQKRQEQWKQRQEIQDMIRKRLLEEQSKLKELEDLRLSLAEEEQWLMAEELEKLEEKRKLELRHELYKVCKLQLQEKEERRLKEKKEEEELRKQLVKQFEEDLKLHEKTERVRRMRQRELKEDIDKLIATQRLARDKERQLEADEEKYIEERHKFRQELVEEERKKLLKEYGPSLVGYFTPGLIKSKEDLKLIGPEALEYYGSVKDNSGAA